MLRAEFFAVRPARRARLTACLALLSIAGTFLALGTTATPVAAYVTQTASFSGLGCSNDNATSSWGSVKVPANAVTATFTITGGGGGGGDDNDGAGGVGGRGGIVTGTVPVTPGHYVWAKVGCGGPDASLTADGYTRGGNSNNQSGAGGGSTGLCISSSDTSCSTGTVHAIAGGGGGGGRAFDGQWLVCDNQNGGAGGSANAGTESSGQRGGVGIGGGRGSGGGGSSSYGGAGGGGNGQGPGHNPNGTTGNNTGGAGGAGDGGTGGNGGDATSVSPSGSGGSGGTPVQSNNLYSGGGGGGYTGGGAGGGGQDGGGCDNVAGAGGGGGSSWVSGSVSSYSWGAASGNANCTNKGVGTSPGVGGPRQEQGCDGNATISFKINTLPTGANAGPVAVNKTAYTPINLTVTEPADEGTATCEVLGGPTKGTISQSNTAANRVGCTVGFKGNVNTSGPDSFTYRIIDSDGAISPTYTVSVNIANTLPVASANTVTVDAGQPTVINLGNTDADLDGPLTCEVQVLPNKGTLSGGSTPGGPCSRTFTAPAGTSGQTTFSYRVNDGTGNSSPATITVNIATPDLTVAKSATSPVNEGTTATYTLTASTSAAAVASPNTVIVDTLPAGQTFVSSSNANGFSCLGSSSGTVVTCTRTTAIPKSTSLAVTVTVAVAEGATTTANTATISNPFEVGTALANNTGTATATINNRPVADAADVGTDVDAAVAITLTASDPNGDQLTFQPGLGTTSNGGTVSGAGANVTYTPADDYQGVDTFTFTVTDPGGLTSAPKTVTIYVGGGRIAGTLIDEQTAAPLGGIEVRVVDYADPQAPVLVATAITAPDGTYDVGDELAAGGLTPASTYKIRFVDPTDDHLPEWFDDKATSALAGPIVIANGTAVTADAALTRAVRITGNLKSMTGGTNIEGLQVRLYTNGSSQGSRAATTDATGSYAFELLPAGTYQLYFRDLNTKSPTFVSEYYNEGTTLESATAIVATVGQQISINETLARVTLPVPPSGVVSGTVTSEADETPIPGIQVRLYPATGNSRAATTDADGHYAFTAVPPGSYKLFFRDVNTGQWISEYNGNQPDATSSAAVTVTNQSTTTIDAALQPKVAPVPSASVVEGTVYRPDGVTPLAGVQVRIYVNGQAAGSSATTTDANGHYSFGGRAPGQYQLFFRPLNMPYVAEWHADKVDQASSDPVTLGNEAPTVIDATLAAK